MSDETGNPAAATGGKAQTDAERFFRDEISRDLEVRDARSVNRLFEDEGLDHPVIDWAPEPERLPVAPLPFLLDYWRGLPQVNGLPLASAIDAQAMQPALGYIMLLDVIERGRDFRYRLYGTRIAESSGFDMTGRCTSELRPGAYVSRFFLAVYRAVLVRRAPIYTRHNPPPTISISTWDRLALPLGDAAGEPVRILCGNVPGAWRSPDS